MTDKNTSTLKSYVDSAAGTVQSALGSLTGNTADKSQGEARRDRAAAEHDASHGVAKAGPLNVSSSGAATVDDPNRTQGSWNQTVGSGKEMLGNVVGAEGLRQEGIRQNQEGKGQEADGQMRDLSGGVADRAKGTLGSVGAALTNDREKQEHYQAMHDRGKTQQRSVEAELKKQANH